MTPLEAAQEEVKPDMTPMIDCVFLMIIFFVCIDFKVLESKLPAYLPKEKGTIATIVAPQEHLAVKVLLENEGTPIYPTGIAPGAINKATNRPHRFKLVGHSVRFEVGPKPFATIDEVRAELRRIAQDPRSMVPDLKTGGRKLLPCVIEAHPGTCYDDVTKTADACHQAGFKEINFGGS